MKTKLFLAMSLLLAGATGVSLDSQQAATTKSEFTSSNFDRYPGGGSDRHGGGYGYNYRRASRLSNQMTYQARDLLNTVQDSRQYRIIGNARRVVWAADSIANSFQQRSRAFIILRKIDNELRPSMMQLRSALDRLPNGRQAYQIRNQLRDVGQLARQIRYELNSVAGPGRPGPEPGRPGPGGPVGGQIMCKAVDTGWEEHFGGHIGYGRSLRMAQQAALQSCRRAHGSCRIQSCN